MWWYTGITYVYIAMSHSCSGWAYRSVPRYSTQRFCCPGWTTSAREQCRTREYTQKNKYLSDLTYVGSSYFHGLFFQCIRPLMISPLKLSFKEVKKSCVYLITYVYFNIIRYIGLKLLNRICQRSNIGYDMEI